MKKILITLLALTPLCLMAQESTKRQQKQEARKERINKLIKQEEEGALIFQKQGAFGIKLNTDGYGIYYEHGRYKSITKTNSWWMELGERKDRKEEKTSPYPTQLGSLIILGNPYVFGKENNFYYFKLGLSQQILIGGKGNKNGVAVSAIYGGGFSLGMLKPYYIQVQPANSSTTQDIKYNNNDSVFLDPNVILGASSFGKGFNEIQFIPGFHAKTALRFDYGRYNEILSALEVGLNAEYYTKDMPIMVNSDPKKFFLNAYIAIVFGKRK
ncbi:MAG: hypothetical protein KGO81_08015 [Bacteroidota bacterium]|nr:hypothetical protein [Bacteroidota bacterium]